jgi:hypothetical protein
MGFKKYVAAALACAALVGCGGGGGPSLPNDPSTSAGVWSGTTTDGRQLLAFLLGDGTYSLVYGAASENLTVGASSGTASSVGTTFTSTDGVDFNVGVPGLTPLSVDGTFTPQRTFSGNLRRPDSSVNFITTFVDTLPSHLDNIAGNYSGQVATSTTNTIDDFQIAISSSGSIGGSSPGGCTFTGTVASRADIGVFNVTLTFGGGVCALGTATVSGVAYLDDVTHVLYSTAFNSSRTLGVIAVALKS